MNTQTAAFARRWRNAAAPPKARPRAQRHWTMARRKKLFAIAAALAVVAVAVGLAAQYNKESRAAVRKTPVAVPVTVAPVVAKTVPVRLYAIGNVEPFTTVAVKARVDGQIVSVHFNEGRSEEHTSELQSQFHLVCRLLLE